MIFLRSSIGKFGSSLAAPFLKGGQDESRGTFQKFFFIYYLHHLFCLSAISLLLEVAGNTIAHVLKIDSACFYCLLELEIIGSNKGL